MNDLQFSLITSDKENCSKSFSYEDNKLVKTPGGQIYSGRLDVRSVPSLKEYLEVLAGLEPNQCCVYGLPKNQNLDTFELVLKGQVKTDNQISRTKDMMEYRNESAGIVMADFDYVAAGVNATLLHSKQACRDILLEVLPELNGIEMAVVDSASSWLFHSETGEFLKGEGGKHIYIALANMEYAQHFADVLNDRLWLKGYGCYNITNAGTLRETTCFDMSIYQPSRIDFCAGAICLSPVEQRREDVLYVPGTRLFANELKPASTYKLKQIEKLKEDLKERRRVEAAPIREAYIQVLSKKQKSLHQNLTDSECRSIIERMLDRQELAPECLLYDERNGTAVSVAEILANPKDYHGKMCLDPIEPEYDDWKQVGIIYSDQSQPCIYSQAHGGITYKILKPVTSEVSGARIKVVIEEGNQTSAARKCLEVLKKQNRIFYDPALDNVVEVREERKPHDKGCSLSISKLKNGQLKSILEERFTFYYESNQDKIISVTDKSISDVRDLGIEGLEQLNGISKVPVIRHDLTIASAEGFDLESGYYIRGQFNIIEHPTQKQCADAFSRVWHPFSEYKFLDQPVANSCLLALLMNVVTLPLCTKRPFYLISGSTAGSGKSKIADSILYLLNETNNHEHYPDDNETEFAKLMLSVLAKKKPCMVWDNIPKGKDLKSPFLSNLATSGEMTLRMLHTNDVPVVSNCALQIFSGNNIKVGGDNWRRFLKLYIDVDTSTPNLTQFPFDPVQVVMDNREQLVADLFTIWNAYADAGYPVLKSDRLESFEVWNRYTRQCVLWVASQIESGEWKTGYNLKFDDLLNNIEDNHAENPEDIETRGLYSVLYSLFGNKDMSISEICKRAMEPERTELRDALNVIETGMFKDARRIGKELSGLVNKVVELEIQGKSLTLKMIRSDKKTAGLSWYKLVNITPTGRLEDFVDNNVVPIRPQANSIEDSSLTAYQRLKGKSRRLSNEVIM